VLYLSSTYQNILPQYRDRFGYMLNVNRAIGKERAAVRYPWMLDNGAFSETWNEEVWRRRLEQLSEYNATCIAAVVPDVLADAKATLDRWYQYAPIVFATGYNAAFVAQDGATIDTIPWHQINVLFIGGTTDYKLHHAWPVITEAKRRGLWLHVGRVNSIRRIRTFCIADSVDGTTLSIEPSTRKQENLIWEVENCNSTKKLQGTLFMAEC
jgi:hypothetical protein